MNADLVFAPEPEPEPTTESALIDWAHRPADEELARILDVAVNRDRDL